MARSVIRTGDVYPGSGRSGILAVGPAADVFTSDPVLREGGPGMPVAPSIAPDGARFGQFTLAQATLGLLALLGAVVYLDKRIVNK